MSAHRFREFVFASTSQTRPVAASCAFMPCPSVLLATLSAPQQTFIQEVYRIARERTEAQLRPARRAIPEFSLN